MRTLKSLAFTTIHIIKLQTIPRFSYRPSNNFKSGSRSNRSAQLDDYHQNERRPKKPDQSYWDNLFTIIEPPAVKTITTMLDPKSSQKQISRELQEYLEFRHLTFIDNVRTDLGCAAVLVAMNQLPSSQNTQQYENRITDFITLTDIKSNPFDTLMLKHLITAINKRINSTVQKNIRQYYRLKFVDILIDNFERVDDNDLHLITKIMRQTIEKDNLNFITKWRFHPLFMAILNRILSHMQAYNQTTDFQKRKSIEAIITPQFYFKLIRFIYDYDYIPPEKALTIYNFIINRNTKVYSDHNLVFNFMNTLCYIPCLEVVGKKGEKTTVRKMLLDHFQANYTEYSTTKKGWDDYPSNAKKYTFQRFFEDQFHLTFQSLTFQKYQDKYLMLKKQHLVRPQIPEFLWQLFKQNEKLMLQKMILSYTIRHIYPEKVSLPKSEWPEIVERNVGWSAENEANMKIWQALQKIGYNFKKEQYCAQRQVDILIDDNIVLEVDGEGHYVFFTNSLSQETSYRNLQLLLSGYKLVVISIFEYNNNREIEDLQNLIKEKVELVKNHGYVYVC